MKASDPTNPKSNGPKIQAILEAGEGHADLYRTIEAGPSGQRRHLLVGRVRYLPHGAYEFEVFAPEGGDRAGFVRMDRGEWSITSEDYDGALHWRGWASSLSIGVDALVNGVHAATGRHDSRRISGGWVSKTFPGASATSLRRHALHDALPTREGASA